MNESKPGMQVFFSPSWFPLSYCFFFPLSLALSFLPLSGPTRPAGNWFQMVSAQERLTRTFTRSSHTYTRTERTEISKTRAGETKREVRVEESTQLGGDPFRDVFGGFMGPFSGIQSRQSEGVCGVHSCSDISVNLGLFTYKPVDNLQQTYQYVKFVLQ